MIRKSGNRFSEKFMLHQKLRTPLGSIWNDWRSNDPGACEAGLSAVQHHGEVGRRMGDASGALGARPAATEPRLGLAQGFAAGDRDDVRRREKQALQHLALDRLLQNRDVAEAVVDGVGLVAGNED